MAEPITQDPAAPKLQRKPIDLNAIMGTPTPKPAGAQSVDRSWMDEPVSSPESEMDEEPSWYEPLVQGTKALYRGPANALAAGANLTNSAFRLLPGIDESTPFFGKVPDRPLGTSDSVAPALVEGITQFLAGFAVARPLTMAAGGVVKGAEILRGAQKGLSLTGNAAAGAAADFTAFDAQAGRLTDLIGKIPGLEGLDLTSADDGEIEGRLKNALEGVGFGAAIDGVVRLVRHTRDGRRAIAAGQPPPPAPPEMQKALADLYDMRLADQSPFKGQLIDEAGLKLRGTMEPVFVNVDGSEVAGFHVTEPGPKLIDAPRADVEAMLAKNLEHESAVASDVLGRELKFDKPATNAYLENLRKMRDEGNPEQAAAQAQVEGVLAKLSARGRKRLEKLPPSGQETQVLMLALRVKEGDWAQRANPIMQGARADQSRFVPLAATPKDIDAANKAALTNWVNQHGTLLDNPQTTIKLNPDGTAEIGVTLSKDQWTPQAQKIADSIKASPDMTPAQLGEAAQGLTKPRQASPPNPEPPPPVKPPEAPGAAGEAAPAAPAPKLRTPHQIYLGEVGFDDKTAAEIGELLNGEFVEGVAERGRIKIAFKARADAIHGPSVPYTDAVNPKHMDRSELLSRKLREKGLNLEGLRGRPEVLAQAVRTLSEMHVALRNAENPALVKETTAQFGARVQAELDTITSLPTVQDQASYIKLAERAGVEATNQVGAQAKAGVDFASGIALELLKRSRDFAKRKTAHQVVEAWEYADWAELRGLAKDSLDMSVSLKNALARNQYFQRGEIKPRRGAASRMTSTQIQASTEVRDRILMDNGGIGKIEKDAAKIAASGGEDIYGLAKTLQLARASNGLLGMTIETGYAAMLSGLGTPIAQLFGNLTVASYLPFRRGFSAAAALPFTRDPQTVAALKGEIAESLGTYMAMFRLIPKTLEGYKTGFIQGATLDPKGGVLDIHSRARRQQITGQNASELLAKWKIPMDPDGAIGTLIEGIGTTFSGPGRALQGGDEMVRVGMFHAIAEAKLTRLGLEAGLEGKALGAAVAEDMDRLVYKGQALSLDQLERRALDQVQRQGYTGIHAAERKNRLVAEWQNSPWYKRLSALSDFAKEQGAEAAMSRQLDPGTIGGGFQKLFNRHPVLAFTVSPFHKTSVNIAKFGLQHFDFISYARWIAESKLNKTGKEYPATTSRLLNDMRSGDPIRQVNARGRLILGTTFAGGVASMYMAGMITGRGPSDPKLRAAKLEAGWLPYAFVSPITGKHHSLKRLEPLATGIGLVADISQSLDEVPDDRLPEVMELATAVGVAFAANLTNKSYVKGFADFTRAITSPAEYFDDWIQSIETRFVPNIGRDVAYVADRFAGEDPTYKEIRGDYDAMIAKVPWMNGSLEPRRDILGEPITVSRKLGEDTFGPLIAPFSIIPVGKASDPLNQELADMEHAFTVPGSKRGGYDMFDIKASNGQSSYDRWLENTGRVRLGGKTLRQALEATISSEAYQRMSGESLNGFPSARANTVNTIIDRYRRMALLQTQREIPELNQAEMNSRLTRAASRAGVTIGAR